VKGAYNHIYWSAITWWYTNAATKDLSLLLWVKMAENIPSQLMMLIQFKGMGLMLRNSKIGSSMIDINCSKGMIIIDVMLIGK